MAALLDAVFNGDGDALEFADEWEQLNSSMQETEQELEQEMEVELEEIEVETEKPVMGWNDVDHDAMTNNNVKYAVRLLTDYSYEFNDYTYAEQFDKLIRNPSEHYGEIIGIAGTVAEISPINAEFDANYRTSLYEDGIRTILLIDVQGSSRANDRSMLVFSTQTHDNFLLDAAYSISGFLVGKTMYKITIHRQGFTETNHVELPVMVPDKELIFPIPYDEYIYGYLGSYSDDEFVNRMLDELDY